MSPAAVAPGPTGRRPRTVAEWKAEPDVTPEQWATYLDLLAEHGTRALCAKRAGIRWWRVLERQDADGEFRAAMDHAMELCADHLEELLVAPGLDKRNVVGLIVRLKALRPGIYIERHATMALTVNADVKISEEHADGLLTEMVKNLQPHSVKMLAEQGR